MGPPGVASPPSVGVCPGACPRGILCPQCFGPCPFPLSVLVAPWWFLAPVMCCPRSPVPVSVCLSPCAFPRFVAAGFPFALFPFRCSGGGVVVRSVGRPWPMPGAPWSGATGRGFRGCMGGGGPELHSGGVLPMPFVAWPPPGRLRRGWSGSGRGFPRRCGGSGATYACPLPLPTSLSGGAPAGRVRTPRRCRRG